MTVGVVAQEPLAAAVGHETLVRGGNAIDSVIAMTFAQCVVAPFMTSLGGSARVSYFERRSGRIRLLDASSEVGSRPAPVSWSEEQLHRIETIGQYQLASKRNLVGSWSVMVPGLVKGCWTAFKRFGGKQLSWRDLLLPAIRIAEVGFEIDATLANAWADGAGAEFSSMSTTERLRMSEGARGTYFKASGAGYDEHDLLVNRDLARTLLRLADAGGDDFYLGEIAQVMAADLAAQGSTVTFSDLRGYEAREVKPFEGRFRGLDIFTAPPPSQGPVVVEMLQIVDRSRLTSIRHNSADYVDLLANIQRAAFWDTIRAAERERNDAVDAASIYSSPARAEFWAAQLHTGGPVIVPHPVRVEPGTTHASAVDQDGNIALLTHSIGSSGGSGVMTGGLGFLYNNFLGHFRPHPGRADSISAGNRMGGGAPTFLCQDGEPFLAIGAAGGSRLVTAMMQTIVNIVAYGCHPREGVSHPRVHSEQEQLLFLEEAFPESIVRELRARGNELRRSKHLARVQVIARDQGEGIVIEADPRGGKAFTMAQS